MFDTVLPASWARDRCSFQCLPKRPLLSLETPNIFRILTIPHCPGPANPNTCHRVGHSLCLGAHPTTPSGPTTETARRVESTATARTIPGIGLWAPWRVPTGVSGYSERRLKTEAVPPLI